MTFNDFEPFVEILLHRFMVNEMLLKLLSEFGTENFQIFNSLTRFLADLFDLLVDVARQEMRSLS